MQQVIAIVKPYLAEKVLDALRPTPVEACAVREVKGYGRQKNYLDEYRGSEYSMAYLPKVEVTLWVDDTVCGGSGAEAGRGGPHRTDGRRQDIRLSRPAGRFFGEREDMEQ